MRKESLVTGSTEITTPKFRVRRSKSFSNGIEANSAKYLEAYGEEVLKTLFVKEKFSHSVTPLENHDITIKMRARMVDWMVEVFSVYDFLQDTYFLAVYVFDKYLNLTQSILSNEDVHLLGMIAMYLSSKQEEIRPLFIHSMKTSIGHNTFDESTIK